MAEPVFSKLKLTAVITSTPTKDNHFMVGDNVVINVDVENIGNDAYNPNDSTQDPPSTITDIVLTHNETTYNISSLDVNDKESFSFQFEITNNISDVEIFFVEATGNSHSGTEVISINESTSINIPLKELPFDMDSFNVLDESEQSRIAELRDSRSVHENESISNTFLPLSQNDTNSYGTVSAITNYLGQTIAKTKNVIADIITTFSDVSTLLATKLDKSNVVNNLTTTEEGYALDARQGKILKDTSVHIYGDVTKVDAGRDPNSNNYKVTWYTQDNPARGRTMLLNNDGGVFRTFDYSSGSVVFTNHWEFATKDKVVRKEGSLLTDAYLRKSTSETERYEIVFKTDGNTGAQLIMRDNNLVYQRFVDGTYSTKWAFPSNLNDHVSTLDTRLEMVGNKSYRQNVTTLRTSILAGKNTKLVSFTVSKKGRYIFRPYCRINSMDTTHAVWFYVSSTEPSANILYYEEAVAYSPVPASGVFQGNGGIALIDLNPDTTYYMWGYCAVEITIVNPQWFSLHCLRYL